MEPKLSIAALGLLLACVTGDNPRIDASNIEGYRELVAAGVMYPVSGVRHGPEAMFRLTEEGWDRCLGSLAQTAGSPAEIS